MGKPAAALPSSSDILTYEELSEFFGEPGCIQHLEKSQGLLVPVQNLDGHRNSSWPLRNGFRIHNIVLVIIRNLRYF